MGTTRLELIAECEIARGLALMRGDWQSMDAYDRRIENLRAQDDPK